MRTKLFYAALGILILAGSSWLLAARQSAATLSPAVQTRIAQAFARAGLPPAQSIVRTERNTLVATFELPFQGRPDVPEAFAKRAMYAMVPAVREEGFALYRVTINGPAPGQGSILRYGTLRSDEKGKPALAGEGMTSGSGTPPARLRVQRPHCVPCRQERDWHWNGRALTSRPDPTLPRADAYVRVRGTTGLYRHACRACVTRTGDTVITWFEEEPS